MSNLFFTKEHEWVSLLGEIAVCGITDYAQKALGDVVHVELPANGTRVKQGDAIAVVESAKAASEVYAPLDGVVVETNAALLSKPELVNTAPSTDGWFFKMQLEGSADTEDLMSEEAYQLHIKGLLAG